MQHWCKNYTYLYGLRTPNLAACPPSVFTFPTIKHNSDEVTVCCDCLQSLTNSWGKIIWGKKTSWEEYSFKHSAAVLIYSSKQWAKCAAVHFPPASPLFPLLNTPPCNTPLQHIPSSFTLFVMWYINVCFYWVLGFHFFCIKTMSQHKQLSNYAKQM